MAKQEHLEIIRQGAETWNKWRKENSSIIPDVRDADVRDADLSGANFSVANLGGAILSNANLNGAILRGATLSHADLSGATLRGATLSYADLTGATLNDTDLSGADLSNANLKAAKLSRADLSGATLSSAILYGATLVNSSLKSAILKSCSVYGISAWNVDLEGAIQTNLVITRHKEPTITVDNLQLAQLICLLVNNAGLHNVIDTITSKAVLILGRFTEERKHVLDALRDELRIRNYLPILFDSAGPESRDFTETVRSLASMARFVIADISDPRSIQQELQAIVPDFLSMAVQPIIVKGETPYSMFRDIQRRQNVAPLYT